MPSMRISYYVEGLEVVTRTAKWQSDMKMKVQWDLVETGLRAPLELLGRWNKSGRGSDVVVMGMRLDDSHAALSQGERTVSYEPKGSYHSD
nr:hypothetical protein CFP56_05047 [Quercus suber]